MDRFALTNVRVFDGERLLEPGTVVIDGDRIGTDPAGASTVDGGGRALLPGLIDCHIHLTDDATPAAPARNGVTTGLDMGTWPPELVAGLTPVEALRSATAAAAAYSGLADRGVIAPGRRADLVLIDGDPVQDIGAVGNVAAVWCAGRPVADVAANDAAARTQEA